MKHLNDIVAEGILDMEDDALDKIVAKQWVEEHIKCDGKIQYLKNGSIKFGGDVIIKGFDGDSIPNYITIANVNGDFKIEKCPNLTKLENLFVEYAEVKGEYVVANCPKLESLVGGPYKVGQNMSITSNPSLKTLEGCPMFVYDKVYVMKNGKRFKKEYIQSFITVKMDFDIFCGAEDEEATIVESEMVNEAMNEPHLLQLAKQLKEKPVLRGRNNGSNFNVIFGHHTGESRNKPGRNTRFEVPLDQLDSTNVKEYNRIDDKADKAIRAVISKTGAMGLVLCKSVDDEYLFAFNHLKQYHLLSLNWGNKYQWHTPVGAREGWFALDYTQVMNMIHNYASSCVIVTWSDEEWKQYIQKRSERTAARNGMIENTPEQNVKIAQENRKRYKAMVAIIRAERKDDEFQKLDQEVEDIVNAVLKVCREARRNPDKWKPYVITDLNQLIYGDYHSNQNGVLSLYDKFIREYMNVKKGEASLSIYGYGTPYGTDLQSRVERLREKIQYVKSYMAQHNML